MHRLRNLINGGPWGNDHQISLVYWQPDAGAPDGGHWVAWKDPDALTDAHVTTGA